MTELTDPHAAQAGAAAAHSLVAAARAAFDAAACSISTLGADGSTLRFLAVSGAGEGELEGRPLPPERGLAYWSLRTGMSIAADDLGSSADFNSEFAASTGYVPSSILVAPISGDGSPTGIIQVLDRVDSGRAEAGPITLIEQFADLAGRLLSGAGDPAYDDQQLSAELIRETGAFLLSGEIRGKADARRLLINALRDLG
jgi:GAF domain-containing protein